MFSPQVQCKEAFYLWGWKTSLTTVALLVLVIGTLRFAINCYGHHQKHTEKDPRQNGEALSVLSRLAVLLKGALERDEASACGYANGVGIAGKIGYSDFVQTMMSCPLGVPLIRIRSQSVMRK